MLAYQILKSEIKTKKVKMTVDCTPVCTLQKMRWGTENHERERKGQENQKRAREEDGIKAQHRNKGGTTNTFSASDLRGEKIGHEGMKVILVQLYLIVSERSNKGSRPWSHDSK